MPLDAEQTQIVRQIQAEARNIRSPKARRVFLRAAVQTGLVESGLRNLSGGDADSAGWRQERASLYANPTNVKASVRRFRQEFEQFYSPGEKSYQVAADVQRPAAQYRDRYRQVAPKAESILRGQAATNPRPAAKVSYAPSVDRSGARQAAMLAYLDQRGNPDALLDLKSQLDANQDTRGTYSLPPSSSSGGSGKYDVKELFWNGPGAVNVKDGKRVPKGFVSGHGDHVHVASGPRQVVALGKLAQDMGLTVRENSYFDPVDAVHAKGSHHYRDQAIDVSGDPRRLAEYARRVAAMRKPRK